MLATMELKLDREAAQLALMADDGAALWTIEIDASAIEDACFCEAFLWQPGGVACLGAAEHVWLFDLTSGAPRQRLDLGEIHGARPSLFGHFGHATLGDGTALLIVLGYTDVLALDASLSIRWTARGVAVDGITGADGCEPGDLLILHAEMDPPGGWFEVTLDARTGRELRRASPSSTASPPRLGPSAK